MGSDDLPISQEYVEEVLAAKPLVYWRFEGDENTTVRNEMGDRYHGRVVGAVKWANQGGNKNVDLGAGLTADPKAALATDYLSLPRPNLNRQLPHTLHHPIF